MLIESLRNGLRGWLRQHGYSLLYSIGNLVRHPLASLMTVLVLGMALLLPLLLGTGLQQLQSLRQLDGMERISVFIRASAAETPAMAHDLAATVKNWAAVSQVEMISPQLGLQQLRQQGGFDDTLDLLDDNPLPWVMSVTPVDDSPEQVNDLLGQLNAQHWAEAVQADMGWLKRLQSMLDFVDAAIKLLAALLAVAVLLVVSNTIRLDVQNRQDEIDVLALSGATPGFMRRPFLYTGFLYGLLGGVVALLMLALTLLLLREPLAAIGRAYAQDLGMQLPSVEVLALTLLGSGVLGLVGAWLAVSRRLQLLHPQ
jgi:cell division transport system permease protein